MKKELAEEEKRVNILIYCRNEDDNQPFIVCSTNGKQNLVIVDFFEDKLKALIREYERTLE